MNSDAAIKYMAVELEHKQRQRMEKYLTTEGTEDTEKSIWVSSVSSVPSVVKYFLVRVLVLVLVPAKFGDVFRLQFLG